MTETSGRITLVIGGAKSGKSLYALNRASAYPGAKAYVATAQAFDAEMEERIKKHKMERGDGWHTFEEPLGIAATLKEITETHDVIVIDCLTLWLSNLLLGDADREKEIKSFLSSLVVRHSSQVFIVSNEVGQGIVPDNALSRQFRDLAGHLNQKVAHIADEVYLITAGIPMRIKP